MRQELSIEAVIAPGDGLLARIAQALRVTPECFVWSTIPNTGEARVWITISERETKLHDLTTDLSQIPGVRRVAIHGPGQSIIEQLVILHPVR